MNEIIKDKAWRFKQLNQLKKGKSIFRIIPNNIGEIFYCDSTNKNAEPLSPKQVKNRKIIGVIIGLIALGLSVYYIYTDIVWAVIPIFLISFFVIRAVVDCSFKGTDYFVGDKGFAVINFSGTRNKVVSTNIVLFKEVYALFTDENKKPSYTHSGRKETPMIIYYFTIYKKTKENNDGNIRFDVLYSTSGTYVDNEEFNQKNPFTPAGAEPDYTFMKTVEEYWTQYFLLCVKSMPKIPFPLYYKNNIIPYILLTDHSIIVQGKEYTKEDIKKMYFSRKTLVIKTHIQPGESEETSNVNIPVYDLGNMKAFIVLLNKWF